jgi:hypothetical protein
MILKFHPFINNFMEVDYGVVELTLLAFNIKKEKESVV